MSLPFVRLPLLRLFSLLMFAAVPAVAASSPLPDALAGLWRVADSACGGCDPSQGAEAGALLRLAQRGTQNPFGADCPGLLEVEPLPAEPVPAVQQRLGLPQRWLSGADSAPARAYRLVCAGQAQETVILLGNGALLMPGEASRVLRLLRAP